MASESKTEKVDRLISDGRVIPQLTLPDGGTVWRVTGDTGKSRRVVVNVDGSEWSCDCPYQYPDCSHAWAVLRVLDLEPPDLDVGGVMTPASDEEDPDGPRRILDVHLPIEDVDTGVDDDGDDEPDAESDPSPVLESASSVDIPDLEHRRDLIPIPEAPVTWRTIESIQSTEIVPREMRGKPATILAAMLQGRDWGLGPFESLRMVNVIEGRIAPSAEMLLRMYHRAGHRITVDQADHTKVILTGIRGDTGDRLTVTFTISDAERAGLVQVSDNGEVRARSARGNKMPWETYTPDLLWARAVTRLVQRLAPDCADQPRIPA